MSPHRSALILGLASLCLSVTGLTLGQDTKPRHYRVTLEVETAPDVKLTIDGANQGTDRRFVFSSLDGPFTMVWDVSAQFPGGLSLRRPVYLEAGWHVRLPLTAPGTARPELVFQSGHTFPVTALTFSPDGKYLLTGSLDHTAILWDTTTWRKVRAHLSQPALSVAFSPDGSQFATAETLKNRIVLWDKLKGEPIRTFQGEALAWSAAFSPDGKQLFGGLDNGPVLWDTATGQIIRRFATVKKGRKAALSPDGDKFLTLDEDARAAILWRTTTGERLRALEGHDMKVTSFNFSPDARQVITGSEDKKVLLWDSATGKKVHTLTGLTTVVNSVSFSRDGKRLLGSDNKAAIVWDAATGKQLLRIEGGGGALSESSFSPDGYLIAMGSYDRSVGIWDAETGKVLKVLKGQSKFNPGCPMVISPDGKYLLIASADRDVIKWDLPSGRRERVLQGHLLGIVSLAYSPSGNRIATGSIDKTVILWDAAQGKQLRKLVGHTDSVWALAVSPDGREVLSGSGSGDGTAISWDMETGKRLRTFQHGGGVTAVAYSPNGKLILTAGGGKGVNLWDPSSGDKVLSLKVEAGFGGAGFAPDGKSLLLGVEETAVIYNIESRKVNWTLQGHNGTISSVAFSPNGKWAILGSWDTTISLWSTETGKQITRFPGGNHWISSVAFAPGSRYFASVSSFTNVRLYDLATFDELLQLINSDDKEDWLAVTPEGLFDGSRRGRESVAFRVGNGLDVAPLDRFFQDNYFPGLLAAIWRGERPMPGKPLQTSLAPLVKALANPDPKKKERLNLDVAVTDLGGGIKGPWLQHNGTPLATGKLLSRDGKTHTFRFTVSLVPGDNRFQVGASTGDGRRDSDPVTLIVPFAGKVSEPDLYVVAIGINCYVKESGISNLDFCVPDCRAIAQLFQQRAGKLFRKVHVTQLTDEQATKEGILKAVTGCAVKAQAQDTLVLYIASHGIALGQRFYVLPHDFRLAKPEEKGSPPTTTTGIALRGYRTVDDAREAAVRQKAIAIDELGEVLATVPALKRVLIFDTCHSGGAVALAGKKENPFAFRGAMERFSRAQGVYCLSATAADELAAESKKLGHSILTYALLAGAGAVKEGPLAGRTIGVDKQPLDVLEWFRFARGQVPALYEKYVGRPQQVELSGEDQPGFPLLTPATP